MSAEEYDEFGFLKRKGPGGQERPEVDIFGNRVRLGPGGRRVPPRNEYGSLVPPPEELAFNKAHKIDPVGGGIRPLGEARVVAQFTVVEIGHDCLVCNDDDEGESHPILVAKPWQFRKSAFDEVAGFVEVTIEDDGSETTKTTTYVSDALGRRTKTVVQDGETDVVTSENVVTPYYVDEKIMAVRPSRQADCVVEDDELEDVLEGTHQVEWVDMNSAGRRWGKKAFSGRWKLSAEQNILDNTVTTVVIDTEESDVGGGLTLDPATGIFTVGAELAGRTIIVGAYAYFTDPAGAGTNGFSEANGAHTLEIRHDGDVSQGGIVKMEFPGVQETALTTDSANGPEAHTHTIPVHEHFAEQRSMRPVVSTSIVVAEGDTLWIRVQHHSNGFPAGLFSSDFWYVAA